jgi:tetratricopeptide (TPR) repeat protein
MSSSRALVPAAPQQQQQNTFKSSIPQLPLIHSPRQQQQSQTISSNPIIVTTSSRTKYVLTSSSNNNNNNDTTTTSNAVVVAASTENQNQQQDRRSLAVGATTATTLSTTSAAAAITSGRRRFLDQNDLRSIKKYVASNCMRPHQHRTGKIKDLVPDSPFEELAERPTDSEVSLALAAINENESALDVPLRFAAPTNLHAPAAVDIQRGMALGSRLLSTLKGSAGLQPHWEAEKQGSERDFAHVVMLRDASMKSDAARRSGDVRKFAAAQHVLGVLHYNANIKEKALPFFRAAAELSARCGDNQWRALNENLACCCLMRLDRFAEAAAYAATTAQYCGPFGKAVCFNNAGVCHAALGNFESAKQCFEGALRNASAAQDSVLDTISRGNLACAQLRLGELAEAQGNLERCLEVCSVAGDSVGSAVILVLLGETLGASGDFKKSVFFFEQALRIANEAKCNEIVKVAQTSIGITKAIGGAQVKLISGIPSQNQNQQNILTSRDILAALK